MPITTFLDPARMATRSMPQEQFDQLEAELRQKLPTFGAEVNATAGEMSAALAAVNSLAAGGAYAIPYKVSTTTADGDPGSGFLRFSSATQNASTTLRLDLAGSDTRDYTAFLDSFDASTSVVKGTIRICKPADMSAYLVFDVTARATLTGYRNISVTPVASSSASPFANNDPVVLFFQRTGDKGDVNPLPYIKVSHRTASGVGGGLATSGVANVRQLNTIEANTVTGASLASNTVTLPAGTYLFNGRGGTGATVGGHRLFLRNTTDSTYDGIGSGALAGTSSISTDSFVSGRLVLAAAKNFQLWHYTNSSGSSSYDFGTALAAGQVEVHAELEFIKIA